MKKLRLSALLLTTLICSGCSFYETEGDASINSLPAVLSETSSESVDNQSKGSQEASQQFQCEGLAKRIDTFSAKGLDGKTYTENLLKGKLTLLNMWGTYCGPCITEMPYLAECHTKYADADFQVVGVLIDILDKNGQIVSTQKAKAETIVRQAGVTYTSLLPCAGLSDFINGTDYIPYSIFVDEHGHQLGPAITGGMKLGD